MSPALLRHQNQAKTSQENYRSITFMNRDVKIPQQNSSNLAKASRI